MKMRPSSWAHSEAVAISVEAWDTTPAIAQRRTARAAKARARVANEAKALEAKALEKMARETSKARVKARALLRAVGLAVVPIMRRSVPRAASKREERGERKGRCDIFVAWAWRNWEKQEPSTWQTWHTS